MKIAVTGGAGFIGGHVTDQLERCGHQPVIFDTRGRGRPDINVMLGDVRDATSVCELAAHVDAIVHLAAVLGTQETIGNPRPAAETNILGGINVLEAARHYHIPVVNICVGNWQMRNTYASTKHCAERLVEQYRDEFGLPFANVRCVNAYGPGQSAAPPFASSKVRKITPAFICRALSGMPIEVYGDGSQISDMVHVSDVARTLVAAVEHCATGSVPKETVEVGPLDSATVLEVATLVCELAELRGYTVPGIGHLPMRPGENPAIPVVADPETLEQIGIAPLSLIPLRAGLDSTIDWFAANESVTWNKPC